MDDGIWFTFVKIIHTPEITGSTKKSLQYGNQIQCTTIKEKIIILPETSNVDAISFSACTLQYQEQTVEL